MSRVKIEGFKYLVVDTGYTDRLISKVNKIEKKIAEEIEECEDSENCLANKILYIDSRIHGQCPHEIGNKDEISYVSQSLIQCGVYEDLMGIIVVKCDDITKAFLIIDILKKQKYCRIFNIVNMELINNKILMIRYDCESG